MPAVRVVVQGRVQGVGFRAFVYDLAIRHGIDGEVWNSRDGLVTLEAQATDPGRLESFVQALSLGPGRVDHVSTHPIGAFSGKGFRIGVTR